MEGTGSNIHLNMWENTVMSKKEKNFNICSTNYTAIMFSPKIRHENSHASYLFSNSVIIK
jgi:hypothetical protein